MSGFFGKIVGNALRLLVIVAIAGNYSGFEAEMRRLSPSVQEKLADNSQALTTLLSEQLQSVSSLVKSEDGFANLLNEKTKDSEIGELLSWVDTDQLHRILEKL